MFDEIVEVKVGSGLKKKTFKVHRGILCYYSAYFEAALKGKFAEAKTGVIELEEEDVTIFEHFIVWLYSRRFKRSSDDQENFYVICKLWLFGDRRQIPLLSNTMIDALREEIVAQWLVPTAQLHLIFESTTAQSNLRKFTIWVISNTSSPLTDEKRS